MSVTRVRSVHPGDMGVIGTPNSGSEDGLPGVEDVHSGGAGFSGCILPLRGPTCYFRAFPV